MTGLKRSEAGGVKKVQMALCAASENTGNTLAEFWGGGLMANFLFSRNVTNVCDALLLAGLLDTLLAR